MYAVDVLFIVSCRWYLVVRKALLVVAGEHADRYLLHMYVAT
jgi:hypothetical protein